MILLHKSVLHENVHCRCVQSARHLLVDRSGVGGIQLRVTDISSLVFLKNWASNIQTRSSGQSVGRGSFDVSLTHWNPTMPSVGLLYPQT